MRPTASPDAPTGWQKLQLKKKKPSGGSFFCHRQVETSHSKQGLMALSHLINWPANQQSAPATLPRLHLAGDVTQTMKSLGNVLAMSWFTLLHQALCKEWPLQRKRVLREFLFYSLITIYICQKIHVFNSQYLPAQLLDEVSLKQVN